MTKTSAKPHPIPTRLALLLLFLTLATTPTLAQLCQSLCTPPEAHACCAPSHLTTHTLARPVCTHSTPQPQLLSEQAPSHKLDHHQALPLHAYSTLTLEHPATRTSSTHSTPPRSAPPPLPLRI